MAIDWQLKISNANVQAKRADVTFTRTDSESALAPQTYPFANTIIETQAQRIALLEIVKAEVIKAEEKQASIDAFITNLEQTGKSALEAWEATR